jgi:hypothetical protein
MPGTVDTAYTREPKLFATVRGDIELWVGETLSIDPPFA